MSSLSVVVDKVVEFLRKHTVFLTRSLTVFFYYLIGIEYYHKAEGWDRTTSCYFITVSVTTVGYGHYVPTSDPARIFTAFYILFGIAFVLTAALDVSKYLIVNLQEKLLVILKTSENSILKEMNKIGLCVTFLAIAVLMGTCFFAVNEQWSPAKAFYWTINTMTTVGYGDLQFKHKSSLLFSIFFIVYCVLVFATVVQNIYESYKEVKAHQSRISVALSIQASTVRTASVTLDIDSIEAAQPPNETDMALRRDMKRTFLRAMVAIDERLDSNKLDCNEFVIEALLRSNAIDYDRDLEPILNHLRGVTFGADGLTDPEEMISYCNSKNRPTDRRCSHIINPDEGSSRNPLFVVNPDERDVSNTRFHGSLNNSITGILEEKINEKSI
jgi:hypothetical protein